MFKFISKIDKIGINPVVDPPDSALAAIFVQAGKSTGPIAVRGKLSAVEFFQTLVKYKGAWRLYINGPMLKASGLKVGDMATIEMEFDPTPARVPMPKKLASAFRKDNEARRSFELLTPSRQKEIKRYLGSLKTEAAIENNIERIISNLHRDD